VSLLKRSAVSLLFQLGGQAAAVIVGVALARGLGPAGKGTTAYAMVTLSLVMTFFDGQCEAIAYQFGGRRLSFASVHRAMLRIFVVAAPLCMFVLVGLGLLVPSQRALIAAAVALPFALYSQLATQFFMVMGLMRNANLQALTPTLLYALVLSPLLLWGHAGVREALIIWVVSIVVGAAYGFACLRPYLLGRRPVVRDLPESSAEKRAGELESEPEHRAVIREQFSFMTKAGLSSFASYLNLRVDVFIVSAMLGAGELGVYTLAIATGELMWKVGATVIWSVLGRIASESPERSAELVAKVTRNILAFNLVFATLVFIFAPPLITLIYGLPFARTATAMRLLMPGLTAYLIEAPIGYFFSVQKGRPTFRLMVQSAAVGICAVITFLTIPHFKIYGAAIATSVTYLFVAVVMTVLFTRSTKISVWELYVLQRSDIERYCRFFGGLKKSLVSYGRTS
jgi:O-antigen/teichoic acid export membrane protein